ncbi:hypothetical protein EYF80_035178 [Liparis tanakae]|uniref:Uncharacterized protein n=1 Tax=Liparis tanakae TaxID=230148 RepID=A0A4Z2GM75_9TELE|nr:hypothetical protein EYF80_035178 [Liparis tanakae]
MPRLNGSLRLPRHAAGSSSRQLFDQLGKKEEKKKGEGTNGGAAKMNGGAGGQMLFSSWLWWLASCGEFCSWRRRSVVSSGPFSVRVESAAGGGAWSRLMASWPLSGDWGVLSRRDAIRPFWYWDRVI